MKKLSLALLVMIFLSGMAFAQNRGLFGDLDGYLMLTSEDDLVYMDPTTVKTELQIYKDFTWGSIKVEPYYYYKNDSIVANNSYYVLNENMVGLDFIAQEGSLEKFTLGAGYKYRIMTFGGGSNDSLLVTRMRLDF
jgi:hypothetical protein